MSCRIARLAALGCASLRRTAPPPLQPHAHAQACVRLLSTRVEMTPRTERIRNGIITGDRAALAQAITLVESTNTNFFKQGQLLLTDVLERQSKRERETGKSASFRIGISGPPGVGKSTFIEAFGRMVIEKNHRLAVLTIDPTSSLTGGSILGDKTRMPELSRHPKAYVRPSPSAGTLGGVARNTCDSIVLCESAGYDVVIVETVGVGQNETAVADMVDLFLLLLPPAGGDELQGIKRGIMELADLLVVHKDDGDLRLAARRSMIEYTSAVKFMRPKSDLWRPKVLRASSVTGHGLDDIWDNMMQFKDTMEKAGKLDEHRANQYKVWLWSHITAGLMKDFSNNPAVKARLPQLEKECAQRKVTPGAAADELFSLRAGYDRTHQP